MTTPSVRRPTPVPLGVGAWESGVIAAGYFFAHVSFLAPSLEDIDSINFALGLREFNPAEHQPHPPGYPVYIAIGRVVLAAVNAIRPALPRVTAEAVALSICSVVGGALAIVFAGSVFRALARSSAVDEVRAARTARWATLLLAVCPLFWLTGVRPMSDMPGLALAFAAQALMLAGRLQAAGFVAGFALGMRSQTLWLTAPLLAWLLVRRGAGAWREWVRATGAVAAGVLLWAVPLLVASGGLSAYLAALGTQAGEDFAFVDMLWANPTLRRLAFGLVHTFVLPWASVPLAASMLALAFLGALLLLFRLPVQSTDSEPRFRLPTLNWDSELQFGVVTICIAFAPYAVFHLLFQETITVRYALPVVAPVAFLAAHGLSAAGRATNFVAAPIAAIALVVAMPGLTAYSRDPHPAFRAIDDAARRAEAGAPTLVTSHFELRRPLLAAEPAGLPIAWAPRQREWLVLTDYWRNGGRDAAWFLANPRRTDLALIDPHSRTDVVRYRWPAEHRPELSGTRPAGVDWYRLKPPGWFLLEGWSLTAETGGVAEATRTGLSHRPYIQGYVRCSSAPMHMVIGGAHLGDLGSPDLRISVSHEDVGFASWTVTHHDRDFLRFIDLPWGLGCQPPAYELLVVRASSLPDTSPPSPVKVPVAIRQLDIQPANVLIFGFGRGWHDDEYAPETGLRWRWASERSVLQVRAPGAVRVRLRGESPLKYFDEAPVVTMSAAGRVIGRQQPASDFTFDVTVPADVLRAAQGELLLETTRSFVPAAEGRSADVRRLGLRIFDMRVESAR